MFGGVGHIYSLSQGIADKATKLNTGFSMECFMADFS